LWSVDDADARVRGQRTTVSVFVGDGCPLDALPRLTAGGLDSYRMGKAVPPPGSDTLLCDRANRLRILLHTARRLTDGEIDRVRIDVVSPGTTLAALQRGEHP